MTSFSRRDFLKLAGSAGFALAGANLATAIDPIKRSGAPRLRLSLAAYSFRSYLPSNRVSKTPPPPVDPAKQMDMFKFVDFCADHGCEGAELTSYYFPKNVGDDYLVKLREHIAKRGLVASGTSVGNNFTLPPGEARDKQIAETKEWIDHAAVLGAPFVRVFAGSTKGIPVEEQRKLCIAAMEECAEYAGKKKVTLGIENHGGIVAEPDDLLTIVKAVKSPWFGINLDTGNFHTDDPYADLARCACYAINVQVKAELKRKGAKESEVMDLKKVVKFLRDATYQGFVALEYEAKEDPYTGVPRWLKQMKQAFAEA